MIPLIAAARSGAGFVAWSGDQISEQWPMGDAVPTQFMQIK
jgi:hypothetical protein